MNTRIDATCIIGLTGHGLYDRVRLNDAQGDTCSASTHIIDIITDSMSKSTNPTNIYDIIYDTTTTER